MAQYAEDIDLRLVVRPEKLYRYPEHRPTASGRFFKVVLDDFSDHCAEWLGSRFDVADDTRVAFFYSPKRLQMKAEDE